MASRLIAPVDLQTANFDDVADDWADRRGVFDPNITAAHHVLDSFADISSTYIAPEKTIIRTLGYYSADGNGAGNYIETTVPATNLYTSLSLDGRYWQLETDTVWVEDFGAVGYTMNTSATVPTTPVDSLPNFQAALEYLYARGGGFLGCREAKRYIFSDTLEIDPSRVGVQGNGAAFDFRLKTFTDPAAMPQLLTNPSFDDGATGWTTGAFASGPAPIYTGGELVFQIPEDEYGYLEIGQVIPALATDILRVRVVVNEITTHNYNNNPFRKIQLYTRHNGTSTNLANKISTGAPIDTVGVIDSTDRNYVGDGSVWEFVLAAGEDNPILRIQSNANLRIASIEVWIRPPNECLRIRTPAGGQVRGHNFRGMYNFKVQGRSGAMGAFVVGAMLDTQVDALSSRCNWYNVDCSSVSSDMAIGILFGNRCYLNNFYSCRIVCTESSLSSFQNTSDAGENIVFFGGNLGGGKIAINNIGAMALRLFATSVDFTRQFIVGGNVQMFGGWLETRGGVTVEEPDGSEQVKAGYPIIDCTKGLIELRGTRIMIDGSQSDGTPLDTPFNVDAGAVLRMDVEFPYNLIGNSDALCSGEGRFYFKGLGGSNKVLSPILKLDDNHNIFGASGRFEGTEIAIPAWVTSTHQATTPINRHLIAWTTSTATTATFVQGGNAMTVASASPFTVGVNVNGDGVQPDTYVLAVSGTTVIVNKRFTTSLTNSTVRAANGDAAGLGGMELSTAYARNGTQSLRCFKANSSNNMVINWAAPIEPGRAVGAEWYMKVPSGGAAGTFGIFFSTWFARVVEKGTREPTLGATKQFISDLPYTGIDRAVGFDWMRVSSSSTRVDETTAHDGYAPDWATHFLIQLNMSSTPFDLFVDDLRVNCL